MNMIVRKYMEEDYPFVNKILQEAFSVSKKEIVGDEFFEVVVTFDNIVVGYLLLTKVYNPIKEIYYYIVDYVCVDSNYRGMGLGKEMFKYVFTLAKENNITYLQLTSKRSRIAAHKLYDSLGFVRRDSDIFRKEIL